MREEKAESEGRGREGGGRERRPCPLCFGKQRPEIESEKICMNVTPPCPRPHIPTVNASLARETNQLQNTVVAWLARGGSDVRTSTNLSPALPARPARRWVSLWLAAPPNAARGVLGLTSPHGGRSWAGRWGASQETANTGIVTQSPHLPPNKKSSCSDFSEPNPRITPGTTLGPDRSTDGLGGFHVSAESGHVSARPLCFHEPLSLAALRPT